MLMYVDCGLFAEKLISLNFTRLGLRAEIACNCLIRMKSSYSILYSIFHCGAFSICISRKS